MAKQKKPIHRVKMTEGKRNIIRQLLEEYDIETAEDIQDALKDLLGGTMQRLWKPKWTITLDIRNPNVRTVTITATAIKQNE